MASNVCRERERRRGVERRARERMASKAPQGGAEAATRDAAQKASLSESWRSLQAAIGCMTPGQRAAALLRAAGHRPAEIERILGRSRWSVRSALEALRRRLTPRVRATQVELPRPTEPLAPAGFFKGRRARWERPWFLHLSGASHTDIAQALRVSKPAATRRIQRIRLAIRFALRRPRRVSPTG